MTMTPSQAYRAALEAAAKVARNAWITTAYGSIADADAMNEMCDDLAAEIRGLPVPVTEDADMVMVPREPTDKMLSAGHAAMEKILGRMVHQPVIPDIYRAMINAKER